MMKRFVVMALLLVFCGSAMALPEPQARVERMVDSVLEVLQNPELNPAQKKQRVSGRVQEFLDVTSITRRTLGNYWDGATDEQRRRFADLFIQVLEGTYLNRIEDYSDGAVRYLKQRVKDDKAIIDTVITAQELEIPVQYMMIYSEGVWQVFDVVIEGVSLVRNYRSSYGEIIRREGYEGLFARMEQKVSEMQDETVQ